MLKSRNLSFSAIRAFGALLSLSNYLLNSNYFTHYTDAGCSRRSLHTIEVQQAGVQHKLAYNYSFVQQVFQIFSQTFVSLNSCVLVPLRNIFKAT